MALGQNSFDTGGFFEGLFNVALQDATQAAPQILNNKLQQQFGVWDHIPAQNAVVAEMGRALTNFNATPNHSDMDYATFEAEIQFDANTFANYAANFNTARASRGAQDVQNLATALIRDRETERANLRLSQGTTPQPLPVVTTPTGSTVPGTAPPGSWASGTHPATTSSGGGILAILGAAFLFLRGKS